MLGVNKPQSSPLPTQSATSHSRTEVYNINPPSSAEINASLLEKIAVEDVKLLYSSIIRMLSGYALGKRPITSQTEGKVIKKFQESKDDWIPIYPLSTDKEFDEQGHEIDGSSEAERYTNGQYPIIGLMPLKHSIYIAEQIMNALDPTSGTTWFDPETTNTIEMARLVALNAVFLLDNPRYAYTGNEADMSMFGLNTLKQLHTLLNRNLGGFFTNKLTESTTNIYKRDIGNEGGPANSSGMTQRKENATDRFLRRLR